MGRLIHRTQPGWTYFVTTKCAQGLSIFQVNENADILIAKLLEYRDKGHYLLHEFIVMPNHLHLILTPSQTTSLEKAMQFIKGGSSHSMRAARGTRRQIWQSGFHESRVRDLADYNVKTDYIRFNPVAAKLVEKPEDWPYSSAGGVFVLDAIPQGLKPQSVPSTNVGAKAPTPNSPTAPVSLPAKAPLSARPAPGLKPRPPKEQTGPDTFKPGTNVGGEAPTPKTFPIGNS